MKYDPFSVCHPAVNFTFFTFAVVLGAVIRHPAYLAVGLFAALTYYLMLCGRRAVATLIKLFALFVFVTAINPLFNTRGVTELFRVFGRPYTLEAAIYGAVIGSMLTLTLLWFACFNKVMSVEKFTFLFSPVAPSASLLLIMIFRLIPQIGLKIREVSDARYAIGKGSAGGATYRSKNFAGAATLGAVSSIALEGSVAAGDSMRSRGYGTSRRTSFSVFRFTKRDAALFILTVLLTSVVISFIVLGKTDASFVPEREISRIAGFDFTGLISYFAFLSIPAVMHVKEAILWKYSR